MYSFFHEALARLEEKENTVAELQKDDLTEKGDFKHAGFTNMSTACFVRVSDDSNQLFFFQFDETSNIYCNLVVPRYCFLRPFRDRTWQNSTSHRLEELNEKRLRNMHHQNDLDQAGSVLLDASGKWWTRKGQKKRVFGKSNQIQNINEWESLTNMLIGRL